MPEAELERGGAAPCRRAARLPSGIAIASVVASEGQSVQVCRYRFPPGPALTAPQDGGSRGVWSDRGVGPAPASAARRHPFGRSLAWDLRRSLDRYSVRGRIWHRSGRKLLRWSPVSSRRASCFQGGQSTPRAALRVQPFRASSPPASCRGRTSCPPRRGPAGRRASCSTPPRPCAARSGR